MLGDAICLVYEQSNVNLVPSRYVHYGYSGALDIVTAANGILEDQILYSSAYPGCDPLVELMNMVDGLGFTDTAKQKCPQGDARRILNLPFKRATLGASLRVRIAGHAASANQIRRFFRDHDRRGIGVAACDRRHD